MIEEKEILEYNKTGECHTNRIIVEEEQIKETKNYYEESMDALIHYMENHEINPSENRWDKYAVCNKYLSSKTIGYLSGIRFNTLCRKMRKELNKRKRQMKD